MEKVALTHTVNNGKNGQLVGLLKDTGAQPELLCDDPKGGMEGGSRVIVSCVRFFVIPQTARCLSPWNSQQGYWVCALLQGVFLTQGLNVILQYRWILHPVSHQRSLYMYIYITTD